MKYILIKSKEYKEAFQKLSEVEKNKVIKIEKQLEVNPYSGKPLGIPFFREKKLKEKRIYYLVYEDFIMIFMIEIGNKKTQNKDIHKIKENIDEFKELVKKLK